MTISTVLVVSGAARFSTRDVWDGYCDAFAQYGLKVIPYPTFSMLKLLSADTVCTDIIGKAVDTANSIDCVFFTDGLYFRGARSRVPRSIRRAGIPTVLIATDDPYESIPETAGIYTHVFSNEVSCAASDSCYLPTATAAPPHVEHLSNPRYHLAFVGTVFEDRISVLRELAAFCESNRYSLLIAGKFPAGVDAFQEFRFTAVLTGTVSDEEKWRIYADSQVVLNLFREAPAPTASPNPRVFEVTAFGHAALLTGFERSEVTRLFGDSVYSFRDSQEACQQLQAALTDSEARQERVRRAQAITRQNHLYRHRAETLINVLHARQQQTGRPELPERHIAWITGCGRTGSTWLSEMLAALPGVHRWHEPYFGRLLKHLHDRPADRERASSFFAAEYDHVWQDGLRAMFHRMIAERYPQIGEHALIIKEVNTPELFHWIGPLFRMSNMILLIRDPFDILDSYLDLQKPGSWNSGFSPNGEPSAADRAEHAATHISETLWTACRACDQFPEEQKLVVRYEDLLTDPVPVLISCAALVGQAVSESDARTAAEAHRFDRYENTGPLEFRRFGRTGSWKTSGNFTSKVMSVAERILGPLRARLGYSDPLRNPAATGDVPAASTDARDDSDTVSPDAD